MYEQLPQDSYPKTIYINPQTPFDEVWQRVLLNGSVLPFIVKPDVGMSGILFRTIENKEQLQAYHQQIPVDYLVQEKVTYPEEYSVFYYRFPDHEKGVITGFLQKESLNVTGNGKSTLWELIVQHPVARHRQAEVKSRHQKHLGKVIADGEKYFLSDAANFSWGDRLINLKNEIDNRLHVLFDELKLDSKCFYYVYYELKSVS